MAITDVAGALKGSPALTTASKHAISFAILKEYYTDAVVDLLNSRTVLLKYMNRSTKFQVEGQYLVIPIRVGRNEGHQHVAEAGKLPDPGTQRYDRATYLTKNYYGRIKFSGPSAAATRTRRGSFLEIVDSEVTGLVQDMARTMNRVAFGDGTGRLARIPTGNGSNATWSVDYPGGFANTGPGTQYLRENMRVSIGTYSNDVFTIVSGGTRTISSVDTEANTITLDSSVTLPAADHYIVMASNATPSATKDLSWINEPEGLASIVADTNAPGGPAGQSGLRWIGQINRSTTAAWRSVVLDNGGVPVDFSVGFLQNLLDEMEKAGDGTAQVFITTHGIRQAFFDNLQSARRYANTMAFDGGYETLQYSDRPIIPDRDCTRGRIYGLDFEALQAYYEEDYHWMEMDGSFLARLENEDAYQATLVRYHQFGSDAPNRLGLIADIRDN